VESTDAEQVGQAEEVKTRSFPIRLTWWKVGLVVLLFWAGHSVPVYLVRVVVIEWWYGGVMPVPGGTADIAAWGAARNVARMLEVFHHHAVLIAAMVMYFTVARREGAAERRRARGEIFTGIINIQILASAAAAAVVIPSARDANHLAVGFYLLAHVAGTAAWCMVAFHLCEGRIFIPLVGILLPPILSMAGASLYSFTGSGDYGRMTGLALIAGAALNLGWQTATLMRFRSGFELYPTGLASAVRRTALVLLPAGACYWVLTPGFWQLTESVVNSFSAPILSRRLPSFVAGTSRGIEVAAIGYLMPLVFLLWKGGAFGRRTRNWIVLLSVMCILYRIGADTVTGWRMQRYFGMATSVMGVAPQLPSWLDAEHIILAPLRLIVWRVFIPLCLLRWWVWRRFERPLVVTFGVVAVGLIAVLSRPDLFGGGEVSSYLFHAAAGLVFALTLLISDPVPRGDGDWYGLTPTNRDEHRQTPTDTERSDPVPRGDTTVPDPETTGSGENRANT